METVNATTETTTKKTRTPKPVREKYNYVFTTKAQVADRLRKEDSYVLTCFDYLWNRQTSDEQTRGVTAHRNRNGFMSSHAAPAKALAESRASGDITKAEMTQMRGITLHYTRQLASWHRDQEIASNPDLKTVAQVYRLPIA